jgi:hypothetical protein
VAAAHARTASRLVAVTTTLDIRLRVRAIFGRGLNLLAGSKVDL